MSEQRFYTPKPTEKLPNPVVTVLPKHRNRMKDLVRRIKGESLFILGPTAVEQSNKREHERTMARLYINGRLKYDREFRILAVLRGRIGQAIRNQSTAKAKKSAELVGCTIPELMTHLGCQFEKGMTWANYGEWEIDHIKPCRSFNLRDPEQQRLCFHYTNLQPLWMADNRRKSDRTDSGRARDIKH